MTKPQELSKIFFEFSYRLEMMGVAFKPRAFMLASESVSALGDEIEDRWRQDGIKGLKELPGIGQSMAEKIDEFLRTGKIKEYDEMKKGFPVDIWGMSRIQGLGPKHILDLYERLKVTNLKELQSALERKKVRTIPGWGEKSEEKLLRGLALLDKSSGRLLLGYVAPIAEDMVGHLRKIKGVKRAIVAGSIRRGQETVGDIDILVTSTDPEKAMDAFIKLPHIESVHERGRTRSSVRLKIGIDADLRVVADNVYGATLQYFTGDKRHNVMLRELALSKGFTLNEYGLFKRLSKKLNKIGTTDRLQVDKKGRLVVCRTEEEIYKALGLDTPPPEIRTGGDELDAARAHKLPKLIPYGSVRGDLQVQTDWTDGSASIEDMAKAAKASGLSYMAVTDHTKALGFINGLDEKRLAKQGDEIDALNKKLRGFTVLKGTECDILKDGTLDLSAAALSKLDWVGVSVHSSFNLSRAEQTKRIIKALSDPHVDCYFHPTCRIIGKREPIEMDFDEILATAKKHGVALEIDCFPDRSDLNDIHTRAAIRAGVKLVIDTDAHAPEHFAFMRFGEAIARRGWATKNDVLNTRDAKSLLSWLDKRRD